MDNRITELCTSLELEIVADLDSGIVSKTVFRVKSKGNKMLVLKVALPGDELGVRELETNIVGYQRICAMGLEKLPPQVFASLIDVEGVSYLLLEDVGPNFMQTVHGSAQPADLYKLLFLEMHDMYERTMVEDIRARESIVWAAAAASSVYDEYMHHKYMDVKVQSKLQTMVKYAQSLKVKQACFSCFDFTPENVFVTANGIRYIDPHAEVLGVPIIDVACFAGVARDAHKLPGAFYGYETLQEYALETLAPMLGINISDATHIFYIGRILQCFLSARFRYGGKSDPRAQLIYNKGRFYLDKYFT